MLEIKENKLKTNGVLIPEKVYIRTVQGTGEGSIFENQVDYIQLSIQGIARLKSNWDANGISAPTIPIDGIVSSFRTKMIKSDATSGVNYQYFNNIFKEIMIELLELNSGDITNL